MTSFSVDGFTWYLRRIKYSLKKVMLKVFKNNVNVYALRKVVNKDNTGIIEISSATKLSAYSLKEFTTHTHTHTR